MTSVIEEVRNDDLKVENEEKIKEEEEEAVIEYDIATYPSDFTLNNLHSKWNEGAFTIPEFQRQYVWNIRQASLLIDSFMRGLPVPPIFLYLDNDSKYLVIDGQQRLRSIFYFFDGYFGQEEHGKRTTFRLKGLNESVSYADKTYEEFSEKDKRKLDGCVLRAMNIRQLSPTKGNTSVYHIFERLNTGGTPLKAQEIRNCVFAGKFASILKELNKDVHWRKILNKPSFDKNQKDIELVLRLFSLLEHGVSTYEKPMKEYLNKAMERNKDGNTDFVEEFVEKFPQACKSIVENLGEKPFHVRGPINSAYLDSIFCAFYDYLDSLPNNIARKFDLLKANRKFNEGYTTISTQDTSVVKERFEQVERLLFGVKKG